MKQKYTLSIAEMEINVITDESQEAVEHIVGMLDRKIREISLKSKRCSKNEAALLCALDFCADRIKYKEQADHLEDELENVNDKLKHANEKLEYLQKNIERLESENAKLRAILDDARAGKQITQETVAQAMNQEAVETPAKAPLAEAPAAEDAAELKKKNPGKNRVGSMFDLLTFTDI